MKTLFRLLKSPALHFFLIGGLLFAWHRAVPNHDASRATAKQELVISQEQVRQIKNEILAQTGLQATAAQLETALQQAIDDEILYRQALALGLDRDNPSIRHRLIQLGRFVGEDPKAPDEVQVRKSLELGLDRSDPVIKRYLISLMRLVAKKIPTSQAPAQVSLQELRDYLERHSQSFLTPTQYKISQIYFSRDKRGPQAAAQAKALLQRLQTEGKSPETVSALGDPFLVGNDFSWLRESDLQRWFGPQFAKSLAKLDTGQWLGPIPSSYGWHLVFIAGLRPPQVPPLEQVANQVKSAVMQERERQRLTDTLRELRSRYSIRVEAGEDGADGKT